MATTNSGPLQANANGEQVFSQSFIIPKHYLRPGGEQSDFYIFFTATFAELLSEGAGTTSLPNIFQKYKIDKVETCMHSFN